MNNSKNIGFTLVEVLIGSVIISLILAMLSKTTGFVRSNVIKESAELQNLEIARNVINSIRRDYAVASAEYDSNDSFSDKYMVQLMPVVSEASNNSGSKPMRINDNSILIYKKLIDGTYEHISYKFNKNKGYITRKSDKGKEKRFNDIKDAKFAVYFLQKDLNYTNTPLLWVSITVENGIGENKKELNLVATIASNVIVKELTNCFWNNEG